ncbi:RND family efflux transporter, MFP subunit [Rivularia sp. PCC 7116]|uniref:efflux RND transporter periplasmic adaptor subunit n=1 Tax=Rivularia sp. PCC 7116 TaxID=373994 RepID=UPI00029F0D95|nr:efflux RND transporter periplasmic adaptor subunit [Rivularia sp. PCC 7116]AFY53594.1 RND family efflux transporter, MFP subunit [Rivularia sp. PCC 7116]
MATPIEIPVIGKVKRVPRWLIAVFATGIVVAGATTTYIVVNRTNNKQDITKLTVPVQEKNVTLLLNASGKVVPVQSVNISPKNPGTVTQLYVEQGDKVRQGQVLARMDSADIQARILQARANLAQQQARLDQQKAGSRPQEISQAKARLSQAQAQLAAARSGNRPQEIAQAQAQVNAASSRVDLTNEQVRRYRNLYNQGAVEKERLDQFVSEDKTAQANLVEAQKRLALLKSGSRSEEIARLEAAVAEARAQLQLLESGSRPEEIAQAKAAVSGAQAQLKTEQVNLNNTIIRAPFSGIITQKFANIGAFVTPTTSASTSASATSSSIVALARGLEVLANVPEADIGKIKVGQEVEIVADAYPEQVFKGNVRLIAPEAVNEQGVTLFQVRVAITTGRDKLRSGLNVNLTFLGDDVNALWLPTVAIVTEKGQTGVLIPDENNKAKFNEVTIGSQVGNETQILEGLQLGDRIFTSPPDDYKIKKKLEKRSQ